MHKNKCCPDGYKCCNCDYKHSKVECEAEYSIRLDMVNNQINIGNINKKDKPPF